MTERLLAVVALAAVFMAGCMSRPAGGGTATPGAVYVAGPTLADVRAMLRSADWWPSTPSFGVRPLGLPTTPENVRFSITQRFIHNGTAETFLVEYVVWNAVASATTHMTAVQNQLGTTATSPRAGDQVIYYGAKQAGSTALYDMYDFIRLGRIVITAQLSRGTGFASLSQMASIANKLVARLKDVEAGKLKPSPLPATDNALLPPAGMDVTLVGETRLPVEAAGELVGDSSPADTANTFKALGVSDFLFGDYALNADLQMEVQTAVFSFATNGEATKWINAEIGKANLDQNGVFSGYSAAAGRYYAFFASGSHVALIFCRSTVQFEAASRACELPVNSLIPSWYTSLGGS